MAKFINPYNFIPFGGDKTAPKNKKTDYYENKGELKSGWLDVSIHMKTPFIVPNGAYPKYIDPVTGKEVKNPSEQERKKLHKKYDFMRDPNGVPFVPGSEIRGMVRSVYEAATDSCVPVLLNDKPISHRVPTFSAIQKRGLLQHKDNRWILYSAIASKEEVTFNRDGKMVNDNNVIIADKPGFSPDNGKNFLQYNIPVVKNKPYHIAYLRTKDIVFSWNSGDNYAYDKLKSELKRDGAVGSNNPNKESHKALLDALEKAVRDEKQMVPVYYFTVRRQINGQETKLVYMSGSSIGRIAQYRKWEDIIGEHKPCVGPNLCPACLLFGTIKGDGLKSHLRFTDAYLDQSDAFKSVYHTLQILGGPRDSAFEFYFRKPAEDANYWNADFYSISRQVQTKTGKPASQNEFYDLPEATPRGRKMYWHSKPASDATMNNLNSTMEAFEGNEPFRFKIFFNEVTEEQLMNLIWTLTLGENRADSNLQHKLGHAKPLGYGSVKLTVEKCVERSVRINDDQEYLVEVGEKAMSDRVLPANIDLNSVNVKSILKMCDSTSTGGVPVMYPRFINKRGTDDIFNWFTENRKNKNTLVVLPEPLDRDITLNGTWKNIENLKDKELAGKPANHGSNTKKYIMAEVFSVDIYNNIYLKRSPDLEENSRVRNQDTNGKEYKKGDKIKVSYKNSNTNPNTGKTFHNYLIIDSKNE